MVSIGIILLAVVGAAIILSRLLLWFLLWLMGTGDD